jgi:nitrite reductase (NADH) large subunit
MFGSMGALKKAGAAATLVDDKSPAGAASDAEASSSSPVDITPPPEGPPTVVVGAGPAGLRVAEELARAGEAVVLFNAERWLPYNRIKLTPFLTGEVQIGQVFQPDTIAPDARISRYDGLRIREIDRVHRIAVDDFGRAWPYAKLVIATGSRPHVPDIPGTDLDGVFTFRDFDDVERLVARSFRSTRAVVIGGGLLGLEAARGMSSRGIDTWVLEHESRLLPRQLDQEAGDLVAAGMGELGITARTLTRVQEIEGKGRVERVILSSGEVIPCDTVIVCAGVRSNLEIARDTGLAVGKGIAVDAHMRTSDPDIYAVGECAEFEGHCYGLVGPGLEQAQACVADILGRKGADYGGSVPATRLKVVGVDVFSMGEVEQIDDDPALTTVAWSDPDAGLYRRIIVRRGRLAGAIAVGPWAEINRLQQMIKVRARISTWQLRRLRATGLMLKDAGSVPVRDWADAATVCNCTGVTRGMLGQAMDAGCTTLDDLKRATCASTVCGTCQPLLQELLGAEAKAEPVGWWKSLLAFSVIAGVLAIVTAVVPHWPYSQSVEDSLRVDLLWIDPLIKQISGFTLLGFMVIAAVLGLRKRIKLFRNLGGYNGWRLVHGVVGALLLAGLFVHTGFHLGDNLNGWLMGTFLALSALGAIAGGVTAVEHKLLNGPLKGARTAPRVLPAWAHIVLLWPIPLLLAAHVASVYFY